MACRLLPDLGHYQSPEAFPEEDTDQKQRARSYLVGACIALEGIWCMYLGRPSSIPRSVVETAALSCRIHQNSDSVILAAWLGLCGPMIDICNVLNSSRPLNSNAKTCLRRPMLDSHGWLKELPSSFIYDEPNVAELDPAAYGVHMQYCKLQILKQQASGGDDGDIAAHSDQIYDAAIRIIRLLLIYRHLHGTEKIRSFMLDTVNFALEILVDHYLERPGLMEIRKRDVQWLRLAVDSMISIQPHFPIVGRVLNKLTLTARGTPLALLFGGHDVYFAPPWSSAPVKTSADQLGSDYEIFSNDFLTAEQCPVDDQNLQGCSLLSWSCPQTGVTPEDFI